MDHAILSIHRHDGALHDVAIAVVRHDIEQRVPTADIRPAEVAGHYCGARANASTPSRMKPRSSLALLTVASIAFAISGSSRASSESSTSARNRKFPEFHR